MSTQYPILDGRPINKWKVTELKEELKRRNLITKGLKDDLVKRLEESIRIERAAMEAEENKDVDGESELVGNSGDSKGESSIIQVTNKGMEDGLKVNNIDDTVTAVKIDDDPAKVDQGKALEHEEIVVTEPITMVEEPTVDEATTVVSSFKDEAVIPHLTSEGTLEDKIISQNDVVVESHQEDGSLVGEPVNLRSTGQCITEVVSRHIDQAIEDKKNRICDNEVEETKLPHKKDVEDIEVQPQDISLKCSQMDADHSEAHSSNQVYEVSQNLGLLDKTESFSNDTFILNETNELKENLTTNNVQLEPEIVKQEMVQPSSTRDPPGDGIIHPSDDSVPQGNHTLERQTGDDKSEILEFSKKNSNADDTVDVPVLEHDVENKATEKVEYGNEQNQVSFVKDKSPPPGLSPQQLEPSAEQKTIVADPEEERKPEDDDDFSKITDGADGELLEKVNLDQSSADDSMEEDASEARHVESDHNSSKVVEKNDLDEDARIDVEQHITPSANLESSHEHNDSVGVSSEKRKFQDTTVGGNQEPQKRQRRWGTENQELPASQSPHTILSTTPRASLLTASTKSNLSSLDSTLGGEAPKERLVPPSQKAPTTSLRIDNFLRPFTLKAVQELLAKTGTVGSFWMDHIKTHCYVMYSKVEEAIETRNAVYNLQWPPNGGRLLIAEFVDPEEVRLRVEVPPTPAAPAVNTSTSAVAPQAPQPAAPTQHPVVRPHQEPPNPLSRQPPGRDHPSMMRDKMPRPPSPVSEKTEPPVVTLDDLFRKTRATPRIYYLPLSDEQVAAKVARQKRSRLM